MNPDGGVPSATRSVARVVAAGTATSRGSRGIARGRLWASEFGQNTRDEVNLIRRGRNYGWPDGRGRRLDAQGGRFTNPL